jgi:hypothetical protein
MDREIRALRNIVCAQENRTHWINEDATPFWRSSFTIPLDESYRPGWRSAVAWLEQREQQRNDAAAAVDEWPWPKRPLDFDSIEQRLVDHYMDNS